MKKPEIQQAIVLGGGLEIDGSLSDQSRQRAIGAAIFTKKYGIDRLVFSGGNSFWQPENRVTESEAEQMADVANFYGAEVDTVLCESESQDTFENLINSRELLLPDRNTAVITHDYHIPRSLAVARKVLCMPVFGIAVKPYDLAPRAAVNEAMLLAITKGILTGVKQGDIETITERKDVAKAALVRVKS